MSTPKILSLALVLSAAWCSLAPQQVEAGVIVLHNGKVFVGRIRPEEDGKRQVTMRWPYKQQTQRGKQVFEHGQLPHNIRWHRRNDANGEEYDQPNDEYWEKFGDLEKYPLDQRYLELYEQWKLRQERRAATFDPVMILDDPMSKGPRLAAVPEESNPLFKINRPEGWSASVEDEITIFKASEGLEGYLPRIHVFAGPRLKGRADAIVGMFEEQMSKAADPGTWKITDRPSPRTRGSGYDYAFTSQSTVRGRNVVAMRKIFIREKHIYFVVAYCHEKEFPELRGLFTRCSESMEIAEDQAKPRKPAPAATPGAPR